MSPSDDAHEACRDIVRTMRRLRVVSLGAALGSGFGIVLLGLLGASTMQGCGYDWSFPGEGLPTVDAGPDNSTQPPKDGPDDLGDTSPPTPPPPPVACKPTLQCAPGSYCRYPDRLCGIK